MHLSNKIWLQAAKKYPSAKITEAKQPLFHLSVSGGTQAMNTYQRLFLQAILFGLILAAELELIPGNTDFTQFIGPNAYLNGVLMYMLVCVATYCNVKSTSRSSKWIEAIPIGFATLIQLTIAGGAVKAALSATNNAAESAAATVSLLALHTSGFAGWYLYRLYRPKIQ